MEKRNKTKIIPGPVGLPLLGNVLSLDKSKLQSTLYAWMKKYGEVFKFSMLSQEIVIINDTNLMRKTFDELRLRPLKDFPNNLNFNGSGAALSNFDGNLDTVKQITWKIFRETYRDSHIKELQDGILDEFIDWLIEKSGDAIDVGEALLNSIGAQFAAEMTGNRPSDDVMQSCLDYFQAVNGIFTEGHSFILTVFPWMSNVPGKLKSVVNFAKTTMERVTQVLLKDARKQYTNGDEHGIIHRFLREKQKINDQAGHELVTDDNLFASCIIDVIAGAFAGTAGNISVCFFYMLHYPEIYRKLDDEVTELRKSKVIHDVTPSDLPYLYAYIMECMRLASILSISLPHYVDEDRIIGDYLFKKGSVVLGGIFNVHHKEETWSDPFQLRPERFLDESGKLISDSHPLRQEFVPFSVGQRSCKGRDTGMDKVFKYVSRILYRCEVLHKEGFKLPPADPRDFKILVALLVPRYTCVFSKRR